MWIGQSEKNLHELFELARPAPKVPIREIARHEGGKLFSDVDVRVGPALPGLEAWYARLRDREPFRCRVMIPLT